MDISLQPTGGGGGTKIKQKKERIQIKIKFFPGSCEEKKNEKVTQPTF